MLRIVSVLMGAIILLSAGFVRAEEIVYDRILVKINDSIITQYDLEEEMRPIMEKIKGRTLSAAEKKQLDGLRKQALERMVNDTLLAQEVEKYGVVISDDMIDGEIDRIKKQRGINDEEFAEMMKAEGLTVEEFRAKLKATLEKQEVLGYMVHQKVLVTDTEIQKEYDAHREDYLLEKMIELAIIILPSDVSPTEVSMRIKDGEMTFAEGVEKYSIGPGKDKGGSIGEVSWNDLADEWVESLAGVPEGGLGSPIVVQGNEALLSPVKIIEDRLVPLEEVKDDIFQRLTEAKRDELFDEYFDKLKQSSVIVYMEESDMPENGVSQ